MANFNFTSQSTETRNSAVANIFSNVTVKQVAEKFIKKLRKAESFDEGKRNVSAEIQIKSSDTFRVTIDGGFNENNGNYWCNIHIEEKMGNRFVHFSKSNNLRGNEGVWCKVLSALYCGIIDEIAVMIDYELSRWEKEINREKINGTNFGWAIHKWETITGCEYVENCAENNKGVTSLDMDSSVAVVEQEISNAPSLDGWIDGERAWDDDVYYVNSEYDIDRGIERVADTIEKYLGSYNPSYLDSFGECVITVYWDSFTEQDMKMLIENDIFAMSVRDTLYDRGVIQSLSGFLVYDDGVYVTVDYDKTFDKSIVLNTLRREYNYPWCDDDDVYEMPINTLADRCGGYHVIAPIYVMYDKENDSYYVNGTSGDDSINDELTSKTTYMELYDMITETINVADTIENALDDAMESDDVYYDDVICQIGKWFVKYTSPCDKFPSGCVCVVDAKGVNMGGTWCSVADFDTAVEYLVNTIEMCNKEFNNVA